MKTEQLNDLAFNLIEVSLTPTESEVVKYLEANKIPYEDWDYFLVFMKHWIHIKVDLNFADTLMFLSGYVEGIR